MCYIFRFLRTEKNQDTRFFPLPQILESIFTSLSESHFSGQLEAEKDMLELLKGLRWQSNTLIRALFPGKGKQATSSLQY